MCFSPQRRAIFRHQNFKKCSETDVFCTFSLPNVSFATAACIFSTSELQKVLSEWGVLYIFTSKCAFRHSGVQFFDIGTSKSAPRPPVFEHFHFQMCFSPQRRANFWHRNFKKCSRNEVFCTFSLPNVCFATAACNFWCLLSAPTSAPAALTGLLLDWPDTRIIEKTQHFATSLTFGADVSSFFWLSRYIASSFCWLDYSTLLFNCPYCRKFLFKLPSMNCRSIHRITSWLGLPPENWKKWQQAFAREFVIRTLDRTWQNHPLPSRSPHVSRTGHIGQLSHVQMISHSSIAEFGSDRVCTAKGSLLFLLFIVVRLKVLLGFQLMDIEY